MQGKIFYSREGTNMFWLLATNDQATDNKKFGSYYCVETLTAVHFLKTLASRNHYHCSLRRKKQLKFSSIF